MKKNGMTSVDAIHNTNIVTRNLDINRSKINSQRISSHLFGISDEASTGKIISLISVLVLVLVWQIVVTTRLIPSDILPSPIIILDTLYKYSFNRYAGYTLWENLGVSLVRIYTSFLAAVISGVIIGIAMGISNIINKIISPFVEFFRPLPPLAYLPYMIVVLGIGETEKVVLIYLSMLAPVIIASRSGALSVPRESIHMAYSMGANKWQILTKVILRYSLPYIVSGIRIALGFGWVTLVAAEMIGANRGIGHMIFYAGDFVQMNIVMTGIILLGVSAMVGDYVIRHATRTFISWSYNS
ncbi:ABC transporter permease [Acidithiobacillus ferrianus]|uniref:ABC transporter permease n=1 Tax=Acidithiobacillus ferrianus TaxID=2678518 RepID=UPI0034E59D2E